MGSSTLVWDLLSFAGCSHKYAVLAPTPYSLHVDPACAAFPDIETTGRHS